MEYVIRREYLPLLFAECSLVSLPIQNAQSVLLDDLRRKGVADPLDCFLRACSGGTDAIHQEIRRRDVTAIQRTMLLVLQSALVLYIRQEQHRLYRYVPYYAPGHAHIALALCHHDDDWKEEYFKLIPWVVPMDFNVSIEMQCWYVTQLSPEVQQAVVWMVKDTVDVWRGMAWDRPLVDELEYPSASIWAEMTLHR